MKIRIASSIALAAALALGATGCSLIAPIATMTPYAPSDGIDVSVGGVDARNLMLIADESGENFNVVFTGVNTGDAPAELTINFMDENSQLTAGAGFTVEPGSTVFGHPEGEAPPTFVTIPNLEAGAMITGFLQIPGIDEVERQIPVLDGQLAEYEDFVLDVQVLPDGAEGADDAEEPADEAGTAE